MTNWRRRPPQEELEYLWADGDGLPTRTTGMWTLHKLAILSNYERAFNRATQKASVTNYVEGFAGHGLNQIRDNNQFVYGSALLAARSQPGFTSLLLLEKDTAAFNALKARLSNYPSALVRAGDCNERLVGEMAALLDPRAPTLCVLDPNGVELKWSTVEQISQFRSGTRKTELLITFARNMALLRLLRIRGDMDQQTRFLVDAFFGTREWEHIYDQRRNNELRPQEASARYLGLYEERLHSELGYKHVFSTNVRQGGHAGKPLYLLTFASDADAGERIMRHVFERMRPLDRQLSLL